jgi:hypothetical protein
MRCLFCSELESVEHLFFGCDIAKNVWDFVSTIMKKQVGHDYESVARLWVSNEANGAVNTLTSAVFWNMWKMRNEIFFGRLIWSGMQSIWRRIARLLRKWMPLCKERWQEKIEDWCVELEKKALELPQIEWR